MRLSSEHPSLEPYSLFKYLGNEQLPLIWEEKLYLIFLLNQSQEI